MPVPFVIFQIIVFLVFPSLILGQSEKPQTIVVPTGSLGEISEVRKKMLEMTLISNLDDHFAIVPKDLFEEAHARNMESMRTRKARGRGTKRGAREGRQRTSC